MDVLFKTEVELVIFNASLREQLFSGVVRDSIVFTKHFSLYSPASNKQFLDAVDRKKLMGQLMRSLSGGVIKRIKQVLSGYSVPEDEQEN